MYAFAPRSRGHSPGNNPTSGFTSPLAASLCKSPPGGSQAHGSGLGYCFVSFYPPARLRLSVPSGRSFGFYSSFFGEGYVDPRQFLVPEIYGAAERGEKIFSVFELTTCVSPTRSPPVRENGKEHEGKAAVMGDNSRCHGY